MVVIQVWVSIKFDAHIYLSDESVVGISSTNTVPLEPSTTVTRSRGRRLVSQFVCSHFEFFFFLFCSTPAGHRRLVSSGSLT